MQGNASRARMIEMLDKNNTFGELDITLLHFQGLSDLITHSPFSNNLVLKGTQTSITTRRH